MNTFARAAAVLVVAIVAVGALALMAGPKGGVGGPGPSPSASPALPATPSAPASQSPLPTLDSTFVSPTYGYQIGYPAGWTVTPATAQWFINSNFEPGGPVADTIVTPAGTDRMRISVASVALPAGMTMDEFRKFASPYSAPFQSDACTPIAPIQGAVSLTDQDPGKTVQKVPAVVSINGCAALAELGGSIYDVEVIAGGRGYTILLDGHLTPADAQAWLASIKLEPATVPTGSAAPSPAASK